MKRSIILITFITLIFLLTSFITAIGIPTSGKDLKLKACYEGCDKAFDECMDKVKKEPKEKQKAAELACGVAKEKCKDDCKKKIK